MESDEIAIDMRKIDQPEEQNSALKIKEGKPRSEFWPCEELDTIFQYLKLDHLLLGTGTSSEAEARPLIQKVPRILRENEKNKDNYDPKLVSIGPYHYGDPRFELGQTLKTKLVKQFASHVIRTQKKSLEDYFCSNNFREVAREARSCYAKDSTKLDDEAFKCLMFLDGCFVVYFIYCDVNGSKDVQMKKDHKSIILMDLFLLENQLPYILLEALVMEFIPTKPSNDGKYHVKDVMETFITRQTGAQGSQGRRAPLYQRCLDNCPWLKKRRQSSHIPTSKPGGNLPQTSVGNPPLHLLDFLRRKLFESRSPPSNDIVGNNWQSFRSIDELKAAGIKCETSHSSCINNIVFQPYKLGIYARLLLPVVVIDDSFKTKWLNMAAYEACPDFLNDGDITSFLCFMDSLIDCSADVKELREQGILQNLLGSDQHVADLFNELTTDLTPNPDLYRQIKSDIEKHFGNDCGVWITEALHTHFTTPWTLLAFLGAVLALILTGIQTYLAAFPANPPND
ncbi:hypothetical protein NE237_005393 [Protea cynaroides]|uniref:Uncharacterized protein n=1 Tax=Protea cynaroides TaxID=273540 RepID=A0A9Q0KL89_9MAGN|nr:hypothetical protein NE237_005393 [Protea cynaroides]